MVESFFGKWKLDTESMENMEEMMEAEEMPEEFREKMKDLEIIYEMKGMEDEPGKYDWKCQFGDMFTMDEEFELDVEHTIPDPMTGGEMTSTVSLAEDGQMKTLTSKANGNSYVQTMTLIDDGAAIESVRTLTKEDGTEVTTKSKVVKMD